MTTVEAKAPDQVRKFPLAGTVLFVMSRREQGGRLFSSAELIILAVAIVGFAAGIVALATGAIIR